MIEPAKPQRNFWQFGLSTMIMIVILCSALISENMRANSEEVWTEGSESQEVSIDDAMAIEARLANDGSGRIGRYVRNRSYGWPYEVLRTCENVGCRDRSWLATREPALRLWNVKNTAWNIFLSLELLLAAAFVSELFVRRELRNATYRRGRMKIHGTTFLLSILLAGCFQVANLYEKQNSDLDPYGRELIEKGWPFLYDRSLGPRDANDTIENPYQFSSKLNLLYDFLVAASVLIATAFVSEWLLRRREARKP